MKITAIAAALLDMVPLLKASRRTPEKMRPFLELAQKAGTALALALDHPAYLLWAAALHPLWHWLIRPEEALLEDLFGDEYRRYAAATGRFLPRPAAFRRAGSPRPRAR